MSIRLRLLLPLLASFVIYTIFLHFYWAPRELAKDEAQFQDEIGRQLSAIETDLARHLLGMDFAALYATLDFQLEIRPAEWLGLELLDAGQQRIYPLSQQTLQPLGEHQFIYRHSLMFEGGRLGEIRVLADGRAFVDESRMSILTLELILLCVLAVIYLGSFLWVALQVSRPLEQLREAADRLADGDYQAPVPSGRGDEIGRLGLAFQVMRASLLDHAQKLQLAYQCAHDEEVQRTTVFNAVGEALLVTDGDRQILLNNPVSERMFLSGSSQLVGSSLDRLICGRSWEDYQALLHRAEGEAADASGIAFQGHAAELTGVRRGETFPMVLHVTRMQVAGKSQLCVLARDITEHKLVQQTLTDAKEQAESASHMKSVFLATMSHEIRTPLNGVVGMVQLLQGTRLSDEQQEYVGLLASSSQGLMLVINDILDFSKIEAGEMRLENQSFDLEQLAYEVMQLLDVTARDKGLELEFDYRPEAPNLVVGDSVRLRQVLLNLVGNAIKFTEKGFVRLSIRSLASQQEQSLLELRVEDSGIGISREQQTHLFKPFSQADGSTTRKFGGTGLGLAISRNLVQLMGGELSLASESGQGSCFTIRVNLPVRVRHAPLFENTSLRARRALLVDSVASSAAITRRLLEAAGMVVEHASTLDQARRKCDPQSATTSCFDLLVLDSHLGVSSLRQLLRDHENIPVDGQPALMFLLGARDRANCEELARNGSYPCLFKPLLGRTLWRTVQTLCLSPDVAATEVGGDSQAPLPAPVSVLPAAHLLVVEDVPTNQRLAQIMLEKQGVKVTLANNGEEALRLLQEQSFDLVLMDCQMPVMDGYQATRLIRQKEEQLGGRLPVVALTANATAEDRKKCMECGMDDFLTKPFKQKELLAVLQTWLH